jgi:hypothetical protein
MQQFFQNSFVHVFPNCHSKPFYHGRTEVFNLWFTLYLLHCCYYHQLSRIWQWARFLNSWLIKKLKIELKLTITVRHYTLELTLSCRYTSFITLRFKHWDRNCMRLQLRIQLGSKHRIDIECVLMTNHVSTFSPCVPFWMRNLNFGQECKLESISKAKTTFSSSKRFVLLSNLQFGDKFWVPWRYCQSRCAVTKWWKSCSLVNTK